MIQLIVGNRYKIKRKQYAQIAEDYLAQNGIDPSVGVTIVFVGRRKMTSIASSYKNEKVALPVLSFSFKDDEHFDTEKLLGEVYICYPQVILLAAERDKSVDKVMEEIIQHGIHNLLK